MKKSTDIVNLPVFSIREGKEVGHVSSLLINAEKGTVDYLIVKTGSLEFGIKAVPFEQIEGIGDYAVTIESELVIVELSQVPAAHEMLTNNIQLIGNKIISKKGSLLGQVGEYYLDNLSGKILGSVLVSEEALADQIVLSEYVVTYGKEVVIVQEDILDKLANYQTLVDKVEDSGKKSNGTVVMSASQETVAVPEHTLIDTVVDFVAATIDVNTAVAEETGANTEGSVKNTAGNVTNIYEATIAKEEFDARQQLEDRHILFMKGKRLTKDFIGENGEVLIAKDTLLTEELILRAKALGSSKLLELSMSVGD